MEIVKQKITIFIEALETLEESIEIFNKYENLFIKNPTKNNRQLFLAIRDSMILRFKYCTDLFWKVLKIYLENVEKVTIELSSPRGIIRDAVKARLLTEHEGDDCMIMIESRNKTSHIYHEQTAESIALHNTRLLCINERYS